MFDQVYVAEKVFFSQKYYANYYLHIHEKQFLNSLKARMVNIY
jgi:hypothetical protein